MRGEETKGEEREEEREVEGATRCTFVNLLSCIQLSSVYNLAHSWVMVVPLYAGGGSSSEDSKLDQIQHRLAT